MHEFLTGSMIRGACDLSPHGVSVLDEHPTAKSGKSAETASAASPG